MTLIIIISNVSTTSDVLIRDLGFLIPFGGGSETITNDAELQESSTSGDLFDLLTDDAFGVDSSTLILNDGTSDIDQSDIRAFLDNVASGPTGATGADGAVGADGATGPTGAAGDGGGVFGSEYIYVSDEGASTTTSTTFQHKLRLETSLVPAGNYIIRWYYEWAFGSGNFQFLGRVQLDDSTDLTNVATRPSNGSLDNIAPVSGFAEVTLTNAIHTFDIDYTGNKSGTVSKIQKARLDFWRIS